ncbi:AAA family ATPase [Lentilitoribacter sp. Alg239-R112]|uniref:AAA family ATPase n=1 Tax=Lentilitoribacter sp. Alg239-R112 TaxID=2305987 RepID=UPI0013A6DF57|nr:AAA family ATPase [Lentilitoribacter sp. Alg239-R112]
MEQSSGLTTIHEDAIKSHLSTAQMLITRFITLEQSDARSSTPLAGTRRRFVSTVSSRGTRKTNEVELAKTLKGISPEDDLLSVAQHNLLFRTRRGAAVALAIADNFAKSTSLEDLKSQNATSPLSGEDAKNYKNLLAASAYVTAFTVTCYLMRHLPVDTDAVNDVEAPDFNFDTPQDVLKSIISGLEDVADGVSSDDTLVSRCRTYIEQTLQALISRRKRFVALQGFANSHIRIEQDDFTIDGFETPPGKARKQLVMNFKKPNEIIGNHIAKYQALKLAKMLMAYDFDRQMNPFVEQGGFVFTFIGDGMPGTGKTILIQMLAGMINDYCQVAGYPFHYENFGVDQISSYQGKSGQNCKEFVNNVIDPRAISLGTVDDIDQIAAKRSDDKASAGQQEVTAVLMESFAGASTVIRGNCAFGMFSNYPENVDDALRQRASARWLVDGPQSEDDYVDIFVLLAGKNHSIELGDHDLFEGQQIKKAVAQSYEGHSRPKEEGLLRVWDRFEQENGAIENMADVGGYLHAIKQAESRFTGRAIKNITDAIKMRSMDVELPDEWFETPEAFMHKSYDEKSDMISELRQPFTMEMVLQEINRYADSEFRYTDKSDAAAVEEIIRRERQRERAIGEIEAMRADGRWAE